MKVQDQHRKKNEKLTDLEEEERMKSESLRQHAMEQLQEQEDEIKRLNEVSRSRKRFGSISIQGIQQCSTFSMEQCNVVS